MQFQVPQFIETEDKLVGPLTLRQFIYVAIAGGVSAALYFSVGGFVSVVLSIIVITAAVGLAFIRIEGRPLINILLSAANFYWKPQTYVWQPNHPAVTMPKAPKIPSIPKAPKAKPVKPPSKPSVPEKKPLSIATEKLSLGSALHKSLTKLQTAERGVESDKQYLERKMESRYQIFRRETGEKRAARRIDYR